jgi:uncharacterized membrane protein YkvA (DUF1232 family)
MNPKIETESPTTDRSALREVLHSGRLALRLMADGRVPTLLKLVPVLAMVYLLSPVDLMPDLIPGFGQLDDLAIIVLALKLFISMSPETVVDELEGRGAVEPPISAEYRPIQES